MRQPHLHLRSPPDHVAPGQVVRWPACDHSSAGQLCGLRSAHAPMLHCAWLAGRTPATNRLTALPPWRLSTVCRHRSLPGMTERFELFVNCKEVGRLLLSHPSAAVAMHCCHDVALGQSEPLLTLQGGGLGRRCAFHESSMRLHGAAAAAAVAAAAVLLLSPPPPTCRCLHTAQLQS